MHKTFDSLHVIAVSDVWRLSDVTAVLWFNIVLCMLFTFVCVYILLPCDCM